MAGSSPDPKVPASGLPVQKRLESWKEIAAHLNRDVSTVRRWEKREGLPVHRHVHDKLGTVYAYPTELDTWLESRGPNGPAAVGIKRSVSKKWIFIGAAMAALLVLVGSVLRWLESPDEPLTLAPTSRPTIAVLYFDNLSEDPSIDWLREGLTDMFVTDLSQSPHLDVLSMDRLFQILEAMDRLDEPVTSSEVVQEVAKRAGAYNIVLGSFMKSRETYRIHVGNHFVRWGKLDEALGAYQKADSVRRGLSGGVQLERIRLFLLREEWEQAEETAKRLSDLSFRDGARANELQHQFSTSSVKVSPVAFLGSFPIDPRSFVPSIKSSPR